MQTTILTSQHAAAYYRGLAAAPNYRKAIVTATGLDCLLRWQSAEETVIDDNPQQFAAGLIAGGVEVINLLDR